MTFGPEGGTTMRAYRTIAGDQQDLCSQNDPCSPKGGQRKRQHLFCSKTFPQHLCCGTLSFRTLTRDYHPIRADDLRYGKSFNSKADIFAFTLDQLSREIKNFLQEPLLFLDVIERKNDMRRSCIASVWAKTSIPVAAQAPARCQPGHQVGFLSTWHSELLDASSRCQVSLTGVNWFGFETSTFAPHGLWARNWQDMLKQIARTGFNTIRLPFTNQLFDPASVPNSINYQLNPDLKGLKGLALMDRIVQGARNAGLK